MSQRLPAPMAYNWVRKPCPCPLPRALLPPGCLVGRSVHSADGAASAVDDGADFLVVGTMFATASHPGSEPAGPALLREIAGRCDLPLIGIGGISAGNVAEVMQAGASGVAVIRSVLAADDPRAAASELAGAMHRAWNSRGGPAESSLRPGLGRTS